MAVIRSSPSYATFSMMVFRMHLMDSRWALSAKTVATESVAL